MALVFKKRYPANPISLSTGKPLYFEDLGEGFGFLVTSDEATIKELQICMSQGRGGIAPSDQGEYDAAVKKKPSLQILMPSSRHRELQTSGLVVMPPVEESPAASVGAILVDNKTSLPVLPTPAAPRVGKRVATAVK